MPESSETLTHEAWLFDGKSADRQPVCAVLADGLLRLTVEGRTLAKWPARTLSRSDGDSPGQGAMLRRDGGRERLFIADPGLLAQLQAAGTRLGGRRAWTRKTWLVLSAALAASTIAAGMLVDRLPSLATPFVPAALERSWSGGIEAAIGGAAGTTCTAPAGKAALSRLVATLAHAGGLPATPRFAVLDTAQVNAFTLPDGRILILRGLIDEADDPAELAGVLAHEMGHALHRDATREMLRRMELNMLARSLGWGGNLAGQMTALSYGRRAEAAADSSAIATLQAAGIDATGLTRFFAKLDRKAGADGVPAFLSDHPSLGKRVARLGAVKGGGPAMGAADWEAVRMMCGP